MGTPKLANDSYTRTKECLLGSPCSLSIREETVAITRRYLDRESATRTCAWASAPGKSVLAEANPLSSATGPG